eukprot:PhF_6_TR29268/c0_g1_i1/m.42871
MSSDEATRHTLRQLKESGAFNQPVLDDSIARDLLRTPPPQTQRPTTNPNSSVSSIGIQRQQTSGVTQQNTSATTTTANAPQQQQQPGGGGSGGGNEQSTVDLVNKLNSDCDSFSKALADTTRGSKEAIHRSALHLFLTTVRTKLPLCILHSLPKFNRAATAANGVTANNTATTTHNTSMANSTSRLPPLRDQQHHSNSILNDIPTGAAIAKALTSHSVEKSQPNVPFDITLQDNVVEGISADILSAVEAEMRKCQSALAVELQRVLQDVAALKQRLEILEEANMQVLNDSKMQSDRLGEALDRVKELEGTSKELNMQLTDKETQMDLFREQVKRRNTTIDELRANFRREVIRYKTKIYELQQELDATMAGKGQMGGPKGGGGGGGGQRHSVDEGDLGGEGGSGMGGGGGGGPGSPAQGMGGGDTVEKLRDQIRSMKVEFSKEKKALQQELKAKLDGKENELYHLRSRVRALEMELEKVKAGAPSTTA